MVRNFLDVFVRSVCGAEGPRVTDDLCATCVCFADLLVFSGIYEVTVLFNRSVVQALKSPLFHSPLVCLFPNQPSLRRELTDSQTPQRGRFPDPPHRAPPP